MSRFKRLILFASLFILVFSYQNCGSWKSDPIKALSTITFQSGNGGGYEGKPEGTFYLYSPNYSCEGAPAAERVTEFINGQAFLFDNQKNQCAQQNSGTPISDLEMSPFQNEFISVQDFLYKRYDEKPSGIPNNLAEVLCRDDFAKPTFEIVSHYDREKNEAATRVYFSQSKVPDFAVSRVLALSGVQYVSAELSFNVDLSNPAFSTRKFSGAIQKSSIAGLSVGPLVCVIGGSLDTSKWALKPFANIDSNAFGVDKSGDVYVFSDISRKYYDFGFYTSVVHIFKVTFEGIVSDFSKSMISGDFNFQGQVDTNSEDIKVISALPSTEKWASLYVTDLRNSKTKKLTNFKKDGPPEAYLQQSPVLTKDQFLFYDTRILYDMNSDAGVIRVYDLATDTIEDVGPTGTNCQVYAVLPEKNQLFQFCQDPDTLASYLQIYDAKTKNHSRLNLQISNQCSITNSLKATFIDGSPALLTEESCAGASGTKTIQAIRISLLDGGIKEVGPEGSRLSWVADNKQWAILKTATNFKAVYNIKTEKWFEVPVNPDQQNEAASLRSESALNNFLMSEKPLNVALTSDQVIYGLGGPLDTPNLYQVDLTTGRAQELCQNVAGTKLFIGQLSGNKVFLFAYDKVLKVFRFYLVKGSPDCPRINEFPSDFPYALKLIPTDIGFGLLLGNALTAATGLMAREAVFVPVDGRPPLKFNSDAQHHWNMQLAPAQNRVYLSGPQKDGTDQLMSFDLN